MTNGDGEKIKDETALNEIVDFIRKVNFCIVYNFSIFIDLFYICLCWLTSIST